MRRAPSTRGLLTGLRSWLPTRGNVLFTLMVAAGLLWVQSAGAVPFPGLRQPASSTTTINYQGRLADSNGSPLTTGGVAMVFSLYTVSTGGAPVWSETQSTVPVTNGLFSVLLGSATPIPTSLITGNTTLWLGVKVGTDGETTPRQQLGSTPYAMLAQTVPDLSITTSKLADGAVTQAKAPSLVLAPAANTKVAHGMATATRGTGQYIGNVSLSIASYGFTQPPTCLCSLAGAAGFEWTCHVEYETTTGFTVWVKRLDQSTNWTTVPVRWMAIGP